METIVLDDDFSHISDLHLVPTPPDASCNPVPSKGKEGQGPKQRQEQDKEQIHVRSVVVVPANPRKPHNGKARSKVAEDTDLDNNDPEEPIHIFTPPQSPLAKVAYFSQTLPAT